MARARRNRPRFAGLFRRWWARAFGGVFRRRRRPPASALGAEGERRAARLLREAGFRVLARNIRTPSGEADLVCEDPDGRTVVIVEVKARTMAPDGRPPPESSVDAGKRRRLARVARWLSRANGWEDRPLRLDVVAVEMGAGGAEIRHYRGVARWRE